MTSRVSFHPLVIRPSDDDPESYVVGRIASGDFVELPAVGVEAIRLLDSGLTVDEVEARLADGDDRPDVQGMLEDLADLAWVAELDGQRVPDPLETPHFNGIRPGHVRWLFARPMAVLYGLLLVLTVVTLVREPALLPTYQDFFWTSYVGLNTLVNTLLFLASALVHELMHLAAARSLDLPARIGLGTRLNNLALQTDVSAAWAVPRRQRYRIYLAGMAWDSAAICVALLVCAYAEPSGLVRGLLGAYVLVVLVSLIFQAQVYMRTDLYFVLADLLRCGDLFRDGLAYARYRWSRIIRRPAVDPSLDLEPRERRAVRIYAPIVVLGSIVALSAYGFFGIPILIETTVQAVSNLAGPLLGALDGALVLVVEWGLQVLFLVTFYRTHPGLFRRPTRGGERDAHEDQDSAA